MKIILAVNAMQDGGAERVAATLVNAWAARGDSVTLVATFSGRGKCFYPLSSEVRLVFLADAVPHKHQGATSYIARFRAFRSLVREMRPDVIVSFLTSVNISTVVASRGLGTPIIVSEHTNPVADGRSTFWKVLCRLVYPRADAVTVLTQGVVGAFMKRVPGMRQIVVMPNPVPDELLIKKRQPFKQGSRKRLIALGRLHELKQFDILIDAFALLADRFADWDLWIWGEGSKREALEAQVARLGLSTRIQLPGQTPTPWDEMARAQAFVLSSRYEGLPMALMESMALGLPCASFDCPSGPRELTRNGQDGLLVPPGDAKALAEALFRLFSDEQAAEELGMRAAQSVRERFSLEKVLLDWDKLFIRLGARKSDPAELSGEGLEERGEPTRHDWSGPASGGHRGLDQAPSGSSAR
jgi:glycosyltransferase involved in cell wall biosynthesis